MGKTLIAFSSKEHPKVCANHFSLWFIYYLYKGVSKCLVMGSFPSFMGPKDKNPDEAGKTVEVKGRKKKYLEELPIEEPYLEEPSMPPKAPKVKDKKGKREPSRKVN